MPYQFSNSSKKQLKSCHKDLQKILNQSLIISEVDFGVSTGYRSIEKQKELYSQGRTKEGNIVTNIDGVENKSKHNYKPSLAVDIYAYVNNQASWKTKDLCYLGGLIISVSYFLKQNNQIYNDIRWGGNWDKDGIILKDQNLIDLPHFEII